MQNLHLVRTPFNSKTLFWRQAMYSKVPFQPNWTLSKIGNIILDFVYYYSFDVDVNLNQQQQWSSNRGSSCPCLGQGTVSNFLFNVWNLTFYSMYGHKGWTLALWFYSGSVFDSYGHQWCRVFIGCGWCSCMPWILAILDQIFISVEKINQVLGGLIAPCCRALCRPGRERSWLACLRHNSTAQLTRLYSEPRKSLFTIPNSCLGSQQQKLSQCRAPREHFATIWESQLNVGT